MENIRPPYRITSRKESEFNQRINEALKRGFIVKQSGKSFDACEAVDRVIFWATMDKKPEEPPCTPNP